MTEPESARVRAGVGLLAAGGVPMSAERRAIIDRETEREQERDRKAAELAAQLRVDATIERVAELQRQGVAPRSVDDVLQDASFAQDRQDRVDARLEREAAETLGNPPPRQSTVLLKQAAAEREAREAEAEATPASVAELGRLKKSIHNTIWNITGRKP